MLGTSFAKSLPALHVGASLVLSEVEVSAFHLLYSKSSLGIEILVNML